MNSTASPNEASQSLYTYSDLPSYSITRLQIAYSTNSWHSNKRSQQKLSELHYFYVGVVSVLI